MYLLSVMVYYDSIFYYNLATNLLLLSLSRPSPLMCSPGRSDSGGVSPQFKKSYSESFLLLKMWTTPPRERESSDCSSSSRGQCSILVALCDISWICGCIYTELYSSLDSCCVSSISFCFFYFRSVPELPPPDSSFTWETFWHHFNYLKHHV